MLDSVRGDQLSFILLFAFFKGPGYPQADSVIKHAWEEIFAGIKHLWGGMNVAKSNF